MGEYAGDDARLGEEREDLHLAATGRTEQRQHVADAREQDGPGRAICTISFAGCHSRSRTSSENAPRYIAGRPANLFNIVYQCSRAP